MSNKPRVLGYVPLFYGKEYLAACIKSMEPFVDKLLIVYVDRPSQGHATDKKCHENEDQLQHIAFSAMKDQSKMEWHSCGTFGNESMHRNYVLGHANGYDLVFTLDADEVAEPEDVEKALDYAFKGDKRHYGINGFINFWRSFNHCCLDGYRPYRIVNLRNPESAGTDQECKMRIYHFSTCQDIETVRYKWLISGHRDELRNRWIDDIYLAWSPQNQIQNIHPVAYLPNPIWNAVPFDKTTLPQILKDHPNYNREQI